MSQTTDKMGGRYGYGAKTFEQAIEYLTRTIGGVCMASDEEQYAAKLLLQLKQEVASLQSTKETDKHQDGLQMLRRANEHLLQENLVMDRKLMYCLEHGAMLTDGHIYVGLEQEPVVDGDYRQAIDKLMQH